MGFGLSGGNVDRRAVEVDTPRLLFRVGFGEEALERDIQPIGIGNIGFSVRKRELFGLHHQMDAPCRVAAKGLQIETLDDIEFLEQDMAAGIGRHLIDGVATVRGLNRIVPPGVVVAPGLHG